MKIIQNYQITTSLIIILINYGRSNYNATAFGYHDGR